MNKRLTLYTGGHKFHNEDFTHLQEGIEETFETLINGINPTNTAFHLTGSVVTITLSPPVIGDPFYTWTAGFGVINGEVLPIAEQISALPVDGTWGLYVEQTALALNPVAYRDGQLRQVHNIRQIVAKEVAVAGTPDASISSFFQVDLSQNQLKRGLRKRDFSEMIQRSFDKDALSDKLIYDGLINKIESDGWINLTINPAFTAIKPVQYKKINNTLIFRGVIEGVATINETNLFSGILSGDRPSGNDLIMMDFLNSSLDVGLQMAKRIHARIESSGDVIFLSPNYPQNNGGWRVYLSNSKYELL